MYVSKGAVFTVPFLWDTAALQRPGLRGHFCRSKGKGAQNAKQRLMATNACFLQFYIDMFYKLMLKYSSMPHDEVEVRDFYATTVSEFIE